jgi:Cft2 family RNA processing exonuclease
VKNLSFSAHADAKGIMQLIKMSQPANVILVHGEKGKMYVTLTWAAAARAFFSLTTHDSWARRAGNR